MVKLYGRSWTRQELVRHAGSMDRLGGVRIGTFDDGKVRGMRTTSVRSPWSSVLGPARSWC